MPRRWIAVAAGPAAGADARQMEENKRSVREFYQTAINRKDADGAMNYLGSRYIQHNQNAEDGAEGLRKFILFLRERHPKAHSEIRWIFDRGSRRSFSGGRPVPLLY